jgi:phospholipid/cholesterol/gamma-HCH transport system ATP-binding protein
MSCVIELKNLGTRFGEHVIHSNIDLCVQYGEVLGVVGASGSGKTTLLRAMLGLQKPSGGEVRVFERPLFEIDVAGLREIRGRWGVLFQQGALFSALTVFDNVALPLRELRALPKQMIRDLVMLKLKMVGIGAEHAHKLPSQLSGGMAKRVGLARALALEPDLLFLDEPTAGLDPDLSESFVSLIKDLKNDLALTVVLVSHDLDTLLALCDRVAVLADGGLIAVGTVVDIIRVRHPFIQSFFLGGRGRRALSGAAEEGLLG